MHMDMFRRLNVFSHTVYHSDNGYVVWKDGSRQEKLYSIVPTADDVFEICDNDGICLGDSMTANNVISFIEADMGIGSPLPNSEIVSTSYKRIDRVMVDEEEFTKTKKVIATAAQRHGYECNSLLQDLAARRKMNKDLQGTVKKKRKIDLDDLDLDD